MKLIELEQDWRVGAPSRPALINPVSVACVRVSVEGSGRTWVTFVGGYQMLVVGECEDIGRQIQEALMPPVDLTLESSSRVTFPPEADVSGADD